MVVGDGAEPLISAEREKSVEMVGVGWFGQRRRSAGAAGEVLEPLKEG